MPIDPSQLKAVADLSGAASAKPGIEKMIQAQNEILLKIYENSEKTRRYILFGRLLSILYLLLIVAPIVFAIIYLPPLFEKTIGPYQELLGVEPGAGMIDLNSVKDILNQLKQ